MLGRRAKLSWTNLSKNSALAMLKNSKILWTPSAEEDVLEIGDYLVQEASFAVAEEQVQKIINKIRLLLDHPEAGKHRDEIAPEVYSISSYPFVIFYRIRDEAVEIVRVLHNRRDISKLF